MECDIDPTWKRSEYFLVLVNASLILLAWMILVMMRLKMNNFRLKFISIRCGAHRNGRIEWSARGFRKTTFNWLLLRNNYWNQSCLFDIDLHCNHVEMKNWYSMSPQLNQYNPDCCAVAGIKTTQKLKFIDIPIKTSNGWSKTNYHSISFGIDCNSSSIRTSVYFPGYMEKINCSEDKIVLLLLVT